MQLSIEVPVTVLMLDQCLACCEHQFIPFLVEACSPAMTLIENRSLGIILEKVLVIDMFFLLNLDADVNLPVVRILWHSTPLKTGCSNFPQQTRDESSTLCSMPLILILSDDPWVKRGSSRCCIGSQDLDVRVTSGLVSATAS